MFDDIAQPKSRWRMFWPDVSDASGAREAMQLASWFAALAAGLTLVGTLVGLVTGVTTGAALTAAAIYGGVALGLRRRLRSAAVVGVLFVGLGLVDVVVSRRPPGVLELFLAVAMVNGVRGTFAYARFPPAEDAATTS